MKALRNRGADYLIEVFRPWDCYEKQWADSDTLQLRFELEDLLIGRKPNQELGWRPWEVFAGLEGVYQGSTEGLIGDCVCWLVDESLIKEPGVYGRVVGLTLDVLKSLDG